MILLNQVLARHVSRLGQTHDVQDGRSHVGQHAVLHLGVLVRRHVDEGHGVQRVGRVGRAVGVQGVVGIAVVGDDDDLVVVGLGGFHGVAHAVVDGHDGLLDTTMKSYCCVLMASTSLSFTS